MKKLFLTSSVHAVAHDIVNHLDLSKGNKLVFVTTASEPVREAGEDMEWIDNDRQALIDAGFEVSDYSITGKAKNELSDYLCNFDYIYLSGGETLYLLKESKKTGFIDLIKDLVINQGKVYIGTSAGSIITGEKCPDYLLEKTDMLESVDQTGYGFVNFTILPHWGSEHFRDMYLKGRMEIAYKDDQVPLILLTDNQYVLVEDDSYKIFEVK